MKRLIQILLVFVIITSVFDTFASESTDIIPSVTLNEGIVVTPVVINGLSHVPLRIVAESLGYDVKWRKHNNRADVMFDNNIVFSVYCGRIEAVKDNMEEIILSSPPYIKDGVLYISLDDLTMYLDACVTENGQGDFVHIANERKLRSIYDFWYLRYNMDMDDVFVMSGDADFYSETDGAGYCLFGGRKLYIKCSDNRLTDIILENAAGEKTTLGYTGNGQFVSFYAIANDFYDNENHLKLSERGSKLLMRSDCISFILYAIGSRQYLREQYAGDGEDYIADTREELVGKDMVDMFWRTEESPALLFKNHGDMVWDGLQCAKIVNGVYKCGPDNRYSFVDFFEFVTAGEAVKYMIRCLENDKAEGKSTDEIYVAAKNIGLICESDSFWNNPDKRLTLDEFKHIYRRFLDMPRGLYHEPNLYQWDFYTLYNYDYEHSCTYRDYLDICYTPEYSKLLLEYDGSVSFDYTLSTHYLEEASKNKR